MEEILKYSALNPLATCFVPSNLKMACTDKTKKYCKKDDNEVKLEVVSQCSKAVMKFQTKVYPKDVDKVSMFLSYPTVKVVDSGNSISKLLNENMYISKQCVNLTHSKTPNSTHLTITDVAAFLRFLFLTLLGFYPHQNRSIRDSVDICETDSKSDESIISKSDESIISKSDQTCNCPPMFGCIIPPDFFGNPFNLNSKCSKQCVHVSHYAKPDGENGVGYLASNSSEETRLEQYSCEMGEIVKDVCNILSLAADDGSEDLPFFNKIVDSAHEVNRIEDSDGQDCVAFKESTLKDEQFDTAAISSGQDHLNLDNLMIEMEIPKDTPIDEDFHPLLDEGIWMESDYERVSPVIEKMIEPRFSPRYKERLSFDPEELPEKTICNPPCSVWCDSRPQSAKDTYKQFIKNLPPMEHLWDFPNAGNSEHSTTRKPTYKRSFSANDCPKANVDPFYPNVDPASKARPFLNGHNISNFKFKRPSDVAKENICLPVSGNLCNQVNSSSSNSRCQDSQADMWGSFAGADSLWQALPDCGPSYEQGMKQGAHKRVRELKRQRSLN